ncbi:MAG TPA: ABC transporter permease, partial [Gaiellales bacterium]|nr:ABC transporter permease [Gaiellales bacterium]
MIDRFRSLPMPRSAVLSGRTVSDVVYNTGLLVVLMATGLAFGWRVHRGFGDLIAALVLLMCFMFAMAWVGVLLGLRVSSVEV